MITIQKPNFLHSSFTITTRDTLESRISRFGILTWINTCYGVRTPFRCNDDYIYVYHAEKHRKKVNRTITRGKKISTIIERGHWKVRVFKFKKDNIVSAKQFKNHFEVVLKVQ